MANLTFPSNPTNGQKVTVNDKVFVYNSTTSRWTATRLQVLGNLTDNFTIDAPTLGVSLSTVELDTVGQTAYITYTADQDVKVRLTTSGLENTTATLHQTNNTIVVTAGSTEVAGGQISLVIDNGRRRQTETIDVSSVYPPDWSTISQQDDSYRTDIYASNAGDTDYFGSAVAIDGDTAIIAAINEDSGGSNAGAAYIFTRSGSTWTQQQLILSSDIEASDQFGSSVAISGDTVIVGAREEDTGGDRAGSAYIFTRSGSTWTQQAKIQASDKQASDQFGNSVAISGDTVVVAAVGEDTGGDAAGAAYIFTRSGSTWTQQQKIQQDDPDSPDFFGTSVAISGDGNTIIVSASGDDVNQFTRSGAAYIFTRSGSTWTQQARLVSSTPTYNLYFGTQVAISDDGNTVVIGEENGNIGKGAAEIHTRSGSTWSFVQKLVASDGGDSDRFGHSVGISGDAVIIGAYQNDEFSSSNDKKGAAYLFTRSGSTWTQEHKVVSNPRQQSAEFGKSVAISNKTILVGAWKDPERRSNGGAVYAFVSG